MILPARKHIVRLMNSESSPPDAGVTPDPWYVVWSDARAEKKVAERLAAKGCKVWLPMTFERRRWSDRWKTVAQPLFPGYLFANTCGTGSAPLLRTPGVLTLVKNGHVPARLSDSYLTGLRRVVENPALATESMTRERLALGSYVLVHSGPLAGYTGEVVDWRGARRLVVWINAIGQGVVCILGDAEVAAVSPAA